jgi:hypothetical protein
MPKQTPAIFYGENNRRWALAYVVILICLVLDL